MCRTQAHTRLLQSIINHKNYTNILKSIEKDNLTYKYNKVSLLYKNSLNDIDTQ